MKFYFTIKNSDEKIATCDATSKSIAEKFFASIKNLSVTDFLKIFEVKSK